MEAAEPEERAEEEKRVESNSGERKREKVGSEEKVSRGEGDCSEVVEEGCGGVLGLVEGVLGFLKVESLWSGEEEDEEGWEALWMAGEAIVVVVVMVVVVVVDRWRTKDEREN